MTTLFDKIKEVTELSATSGFEAPVRDYLRNNITPLVDEVQTDGLGGIFGIKHSQAENAPKVLVAAHMDEVGFMIKEIKADGTFRVVELGGWNPLVVSSQRFTLHTRDGRTYPVISGSVPPHFLRASGGASSLPSVSDIVFDAGLPTKKKQMPTAFSQVMSSFLNQKRFSQPIKRMSFLKLGITVMVFS